MRRIESMPLNESLRAILWRRLLIPYLLITFVVVGLAAEYGGKLVEGQQLRYSRSLGYSVTSFLVHAGQELDALTAIVSTGRGDLIEISIETKQSSHGFFDTIYILDKNRTIAYLAPHDPRYIGLDMSRRRYFETLDCNSGVNFSIPFTSLRTGEPTAYLLRCSETGEYIVGELNLGALQDAINESGILSTETVFIVDQVGTVLAYPDPQWVAQHTNISNWPVVKNGLLQQASTTIYWRAGKFWLGSTSKISPTDWVVVTEVPLVYVYAPYVGALIALTLVLTLIFAVSVRIFLGQMRQKLIAPIVHLTNSADALADGNYMLIESDVLTDASFLEINKLLMNFRKMSRAIIARETLLKESEEQYRRLIENSPDAILLHRDSMIVYVNAAAVALYGAKHADEFVNLSVLDLTHPDSYLLAQSRLQKVSEQEQILPLVEQTMIRFDQRVFQAEVITSSVFFAGDYVAQTIVRDITRRKKEENALRYRATHDQLTGLPNRFLFQDRLEHALANAKRSHTVGAVLYLDLDDFKTINDAFGHSVGDQVLQYVGRSLRTTLREVDTVARLGGDEFVILLDVLKDPWEAQLVADNILKTLSTPYRLHETDITLSFSIGISIFPADGMDTNLLLQSSDAAMYQAKEEGKRRVKFYAPYMREHSLERLTLQTHLKHALELDQLFLQYQPQVHAQSGDVIGVEALLRWRHPELGLIPPSKFIPIAEETGLILSIGEWVLRSACEQARAWQANGLRMGVNISNLQLRQPQIINLIQSVLDETNLPSHLLEIELTENIVFQNAGVSFDDLFKLKSLGVLLAMDDFGSGFSTLSYLAHIPFDRIKIDKQLVSSTQNPKDAAVVAGIISICKDLDLDVIAEGVETRAQLEFCRSKGCESFQGWYFSDAVDAADITVLLSKRPPWSSAGM